MGKKNKKGNNVAELVATEELIESDVIEAAETALEEVIATPQKSAVDLMLEALTPHERIALRATLTEKIKEEIAPIDEETKQAIEAVAPEIEQLHKEYEDKMSSLRKIVEDNNDVRKGAGLNLVKVTGITRGRTSGGGRTTKAKYEDFETTLIHVNGKDIELSCSSGNFVAVYNDVTYDTNEGGNPIRSLSDLERCSVIGKKQTTMTWRTAMADSGLISVAKDTEQAEQA